MAHAKGDPRLICVLSEIEITDWRENGFPPKCEDHHHLKEADAVFLRDSKPTVAEFVGPKHVRLLLGFTWKVKHTMKLPSGEVVRMSTMQLVPVGR